MQSVYSWYGSRIHLMIEDEIADRVNGWLASWYKAQEDHLVTHGKKWEPNEPLLIEYKNEDKEAYDKITKIMNLLIELNGGGLEITEEEITSDFLVKL